MRGVLRNESTVYVICVYNAIYWHKFSVNYILGMVEGTRKETIDFVTAGRGRKGKLKQYKNIKIAPSS